MGHFTQGKTITKDIKNKVEAIKKEYFDGDVTTFNSKVLQKLSDAYTDSGFFYATDIMAKYYQFYKYFQLITL